MSGPRLNPFLFSDRAYSFIKKLVQVILPAFSALYFGLATIWGLPDAEKVVGTIAVITTFLGVSLGISSAQYAAKDMAYDGKLVVTEQDEGAKVYSLELDGDPEEIAKKNAISFKVENECVLIKDKPL